MAAKTADRPLIMLHIPDKAKRESVISLCGRLDMRCKILTAADAGRTVMSAAGKGAGKDAGRGEAPPAGYLLPELLIFYGLNDIQLDTFLAEYKSEKIAPVSLKAKVTPDNSGWTLYRLAEALKKERISILMSGR